MEGLSKEKRIRFELRDRYKRRDEAKQQSVEYGDRSGDSIGDGGLTQDGFILPIEKREQAVQLFDQKEQSCVPMPFAFLESERVAEAIEQIEHGSFTQARAIVENVLLKNPSNESAIEIFLECLTASKDLESMILLADDLMIRPVDLDIMFRVIDEVAKQGEVETAIQLYHQVSQKRDVQDHHLFTLYKNLGNHYLRVGDIDSAEENYNRAYTIDPESDVLLVNYGTLELQRGAVEQARERFRHAVDINENSDRAWLGLSLVHRDFGDLDLAWANLERTLDINPNNVTALQLMSDWSIKDGRVSSAEERLERYLHQNDKDHAIRLRLAQLMFCVGRFQRALDIAEVLHVAEYETETTAQFIVLVKTELREQQEKFS